EARQFQWESAARADLARRPPLPVRRAQSERSDRRGRAALRRREDGSGFRQLKAALIRSEPGNLFSASGVSLGLTPPPADAGLHRASRRVLIEDSKLFRPLPENAAHSLCVLARRAAPAQDDRDRRLRDVDAFVKYPRGYDCPVLSAFESLQDGFAFTRVRLMR